MLLAGLQHEFDSWQSLVWMFGRGLEHGLIMTSNRPWPSLPFKRETIVFAIHVIRGRCKVWHARQSG